LDGPAQGLLAETIEEVNGGLGNDVSAILQKPAVRSQLETSQKL
jgi:hypothetical protein